MRLQRCQGGYIYNYLEKKFSPVSIFKRERAKDNRREEGGGGGSTCLPVESCASATVFSVTQVLTKINSVKGRGTKHKTVGSPASWHRTYDVWRPARGYKWRRLEGESIEQRQAMRRERWNKRNRHM